MADDLEKKPKVILNKQRKSESPSVSSAPADAQASVPAAPQEIAPSEVQEKKKVVVVKKKTAQPSASVPAADTSSRRPQPVARPAEQPPARAVPPQSGSAERKPAAPSEENSAAPRRPPERPVRTVSSIDQLSPPRPNSKQGNLADKPRQPPQRPSPHRENGGGGYGRRDNFTGEQAREGFQNRDARNNYNSRPGGPPQGGPQQGGRPGYNQGGPQQGGRPGYNQGGPQQGGRPGYNQGGPQRGPGGYRPQGPGGRPGGFGRPGGGTSTTPLEEAKKVSTKKTFKAKKTIYSRKDREEAMMAEKLLQQKKKQTMKMNSVPKEIDIMETVSVSELARKMNLKASEIIGKLMSMGMMVSITQSIDADTAAIVASEYGSNVHIISLYDETVIASEEDVEGDLVSRPPVVTIMGHVDHGKTKTLDAIRSANVAASEFGGITQHIGAYMVDTPKGRITFLDTPGHEAFTMMRARGAKITDIIVLVVAADDGVMPQTIEAIDHAKDAKVPIIVAVNKVDKPEANPDKVKTQLSELGLIPEEWGGETQYVHISALKKEGIDKLLDAILLQAEVLELTANWKCRAEGKVIESRIDHGRGVVSTIIVERGTLRNGDPYVGGIYSGRVRAIFNDLGQKIEEATPSMPVEILGFEGMPNAGDPFQVTENERAARMISVKRQELRRFEDSKAVKKITLDNLYDTINEGEIMELKVVIKADVQGSAEALKQSLEKLSTKDIRLVVIHSSAGAINESDVMLAAADSNAIIIGFNVRPTPQAKTLADQEKVDIRKYNVIYKAVEEIEQAMEGMLKPDIKEEVIGTVEVRDTFKVPKIGLIAGCYVLQGLVKRSSSVHIVRDGIVIHTGKISSLRRFKDDAKEVATGYECGIGVENWHDIQQGDQFEVFEFVEIARKLHDSSSESGTSGAENAKKEA